MIKRKLKHIHFDMDGVIADTEPFHVEAEIQTCLKNKFAINRSKWDGFKGRTAEDIFGHLIAEYGNPGIHSTDKLISQKTDIFLEIAKEKLTPIEGVLNFISWARQQHKTMNLVTSSNQRVQKFIIESFGIRDLFDNVITGDDIDNGKPHPEPYLKVLELAKAAPEQSIVIEDSKSGIKSALEAGCFVLAIATSHSPSELAEANPTFIASDYDEALHLLTSHS